MEEFTTVYIPWPFCKSKCPYCDFNSHVRDSVNIDDFLSAYLREIEYMRSYLEPKIIKSIFFGGGTPSLAPIKLVENIINKLSGIAKFSDEIEISLEANPTSVEVQKFKGLSEIGVNRISVGIQSFDNAELKFLGREHSAKDGINAIEIANKYFSNYSFDLMYTLPNQKLENWCRDLEKAMCYVKNHISLYQLTIERGTKFFSDYKAKRIIMPENDVSKEFYEVTKDICEGYGLDFLRYLIMQKRDMRVNII